MEAPVNRLCSCFSYMQFVKLHLTIDHFLPGNLQEKFSSFALFRKNILFFELNFNVTNHSENQASSPTSSTQRINVIRHTFWLSSLVKGWPQKNRPAGQPNKKTVFQLFFTPLATVYLHVVGHIPCLIDVQIKLSLCTELMNRAWKIFVCKKPALEGASETLIMALFSWKSLYSFLHFTVAF